MKSMTLTLQLSQSQLANQAMVAQGIDPRALALKPGSRVHRDRKQAAKAGRVKHKARLFD